MTEKPASEEELKRTILGVLQRAKMPPEYIYAFEKTGRLVNEGNKSQLTAEEIAEWDAAIDEYRAKHPS